MAARTVDLIEPLDGEETGEEFSRKKKSKFQTFKNFFAKKNKKSKETSSPTGGGRKLKTSQSSNDVSLDSSVLHLPAEPGPKGSMGNKALSHDSIFIFESLPDVPGKTSSQENLPGMVKALQLRLQQNLWLGSAPLGVTSRKVEAPGLLSEEGGFPGSPPEISALHDVPAGSRSKSSSPARCRHSLSLAGTDREDDQVPLECSSRPLLPLPFARFGSPPATPACRLLPIDFNSPAIPLGRLDTSAARHRIAMNPRKHKAIANRSRALPVEQEQSLLGTAEGKAELLEVSESQEDNWEGPSILNARNLNGTWTGAVLPVSRACDVLRYSWNTGPGAGGIGVSTPEEQNMLATDPQASVTGSFLKAPSPLTKHEGEEQMQEEGGEGTGQPLENWALSPHSSKNAAMERTESVRTESEASGLCEALLSVWHGSAAEGDAAGGIRAPRLQPGEQRTEGSPAGSDAGRHASGAADGPGGGSGSGTLEARPVPPVPQWPSSALEAPSEAEEVMATAHGSSPAAKEGARWAAEVELQLFEGHAKPTTAPRGVSALLDAGLDGPLLQSTAGEAPFLPRECHCAVPRGGPGEEEADSTRQPPGLSSGGPPVTGAAEDAPQSSLPSGRAGDSLWGVRAREGSPAPDDSQAKSQATSASAKPVRFTIAPAWQRSLSGGGLHPAEGSGTRSTPSSPIRPELFERMPPLELAMQGGGQRSPEGREGGDRGVATHRPSALKGTRDEGPGCESPFGVKLRRTSSLLKYQAEQQQQQQPPKQPPPAASGASSVSAIEEPTPVDPGTPLQTHPASTKALATKSGFQGDRNPPKATGDERAAKPWAGRPSSEHTPAGHLEAPSSEPAWISMAKQKQKGFRGLALARTEQVWRETGAGASQRPEKDVSPAGEDVTKKGSTRHACALERGAQLKAMTASLTKAVPVRGLAREVRPVEAGARRILSLPLSSCSGPAEPPWLSLAKKKSEAWSEMPQIVQ